MSSPNMKRSPEADLASDAKRARVDVEPALPDSDNEADNCALPDSPPSSPMPAAIAEPDLPDSPLSSPMPAPMRTKGGRPMETPAKTADVVLKKGESKGVVLVCGSGDMEQLGLPESMSKWRKFPTLIKSLLEDNVTAISCGALHNAVLLSTGEVKTWGCNDDKALGHVDVEWGPPTLVDTNVKFRVVECGASHTIGISVDGELYTWGTYRDENGNMGLGHGMDRGLVPTLIPGLKNLQFSQISAGDHHDVALTDTGVVYQWGDIGFGQRTSSRLKQTRLEPRTVAFKGSKGPRVKIVKVFAGGHSSFALDTLDNVWAWGPNNYCQTGLPNATKGAAAAALAILVPTKVPDLCQKQIVDIACASHHTIALRKSGEVLAVGRGHYGRLGLGGSITDGDEIHRTSFTLIPVLAALPAGNRVTSIGVGDAHSMAVTEKGHLYAWGYGDLLQLGNGEEESEFEPKQCTSQQTQVPGRLLVKADGGSQHSLFHAIDTGL